MIEPQIILADSLNDEHTGNKAHTNEVIGSRT
jgi:hypothetical protein